MKHKFLSDTDINLIIEGIAKAEALSTGEIRIHFDHQKEVNHAQKTIEIFKKLNMSHTQHRNAVLFFINFDEKYLCILGDSGIHQKVTQMFWDKIHDDMTQAFANKNYLNGILKALEITGLEFKKHFPIQGQNPNELPNEITFS
jgi:uncharacterized membrane protein